MTSVLASRTAYPSPTSCYPRIVAGRGPNLIAEDGTIYFDASGGSGSLIFGHADKDVVAALSQQAGTLTLFPARSFGVELVERYMSELVAFAPAGLTRALTLSSGSDAVESALKLALHYQAANGRPRKTKIVGRRGSYHGNTLSGLAAGGILSRRAPYEAVLPDVARGAAAHCPACQFGLAAQTCSVECAASIEDALLAEGPDTVAAVILEPVVGAALGAAPPDPRYLPSVREICDRHEVLLIFDEVMSGFGRTGFRFGCEIWSVTPDILICGKAISAGYYPLSAIIASDRVAGVFEREVGPFQNGHTHACSPLGAAVGLAVLRRLRAPGMLEAVRRMGGELRERLRAATAGTVIQNVRGEGLMVGFDLREPHPYSARRPPGTLANAFQQATLRRGLVVYPGSGGPGCEAGDHAMLLPPLTIGLEHVELMVEIVAGAGRDVMS